ncbi:MAG: DUF1080 domain-containing protein, partial [Pirellulaceae bacterium]
VNKLRMARKNFSESVFDEWVERCRAAHGGELAEHPEGVWACAWKLFEANRESVEQERAALISRRQRDEFWYADRFGLSWPQLGASKRAPSDTAIALQAEPSVSPSSPPTCGKPDEIDCPPNEWVWTNLMDKRHWRHFNDGDAAWNWIDVGGGIWRVRVQESPPATENRHKYDLMTYCCFSDFNLKLEFRCPNVRATWSDCAHPLLGVSNWGNSGIYIFNSYEVQIHDSYQGPDTAPVTSVPGDSTISLEIDPTTAGGEACDANVVELCGAMYNKRKPNTNLVKKAVGDPPTGEWNTLEIGFMSPRYNAAGTKVKNATITVKVNTTDPEKAAFVAYGLDNRTGRFAEGHWGKVDDNRYGMGWTKDIGPIVLQEHDNHVEFRNIEINPGWHPTIGGVTQGQFDPCWQRPKSSNCP